MNRIFVHLTDDLSQMDNIKPLLDKEREIAQQWKEKGFLEYLFAKEGGAILIFKNLSKAEVETYLKTLPIYPYFAEIEVLEVNKKF